MTGQIFAAHSQRIIGLTKKGKEFFKLTSSLTESIRTIAVEDTKIWTGCEYIHNLYDNGQDTAFYMCRDQINALTVDHISRDTDYDVVLACQDKCLRIVQGSNLVAEIPTTGPATAVASKGVTPIRPVLSHPILSHHILSYPLLLPILYYSILCFYILNRADSMMFITDCICLCARNGLSACYRLILK